VVEDPPYLLSNICFCCLAHSPTSVSLRCGTARRRRGMCSERLGEDCDLGDEGRACAKSPRSRCKAKETVRASKSIVTKIVTGSENFRAKQHPWGERLTKKSKSENSYITKYRNRATIGAEAVRRAEKGVPGQRGWSTVRNHLLRTAHGDPAAFHNRPVSIRITIGHHHQSVT
jgi:hypothetical protein